MTCIRRQQLECLPLNKTLQPPACNTCVLVIQGDDETRAMHSANFQLRWRTLTSKQGHKVKPVKPCK